MKANNIFSKLYSFLEIILVTILIIVLLIYSYVLIMSKICPGKIPGIFGYKPFIVMTGSMAPFIEKGDLIFVKEVNYSNLKSGDVIAFKTKDNKVITHRINKIDTLNGQNQYITKGDNNNVIDEGYILATDIEGIYVNKLPGAGNILMLIRKPLGLIICLMSIVIIGLLYIVIKNYKKININ